MQQMEHLYQSTVNKDSIIREFGFCGREFSEQILADIQLHCPHVTEFLFHGHDAGGLRVITSSPTLRVLPTLPDNSYLGETSEGAGAWMAFDCRTIDPGLLALTFCLYQSATIYVPSAGCDVNRFAKLLVEQTVGLNSLFREKTYKNFLGLSLFLSPPGGYYVMSL